MKRSLKRSLHCLKRCLWTLRCRTSWLSKHRLCKWLKGQLVTLMAIWNNGRASSSVTVMFSLMQSSSLLGPTLGLHRLRVSLSVVSNRQPITYSRSCTRSSLATSKAVKWRQKSSMATHRQQLPLSQTTTPALSSLARSSKKAVLSSSLRCSQSRAQPACTHQPCLTSHWPF